ncbi:MAG: membrane protein [Alphaproteobacteria bacterium]|nr:MAG: membrane protein [Alphaproteobacteria bacterium]
MSEADPAGSGLEQDAAAARARSNAIGIACVTAAAAIFCTNDVLIKLLSGDYPLHQITFIRGIVATVVVLAILVPLEGGYANLRTRRWRLHLARSMAVVIANMTYFAGLAVLPLGEATAIYFVAPLFITLLSASTLGERVGPLRLAAVLVGLAGVVVVIRPGLATFQAAALLPLVAAFFYALVQILARRLGMAEKASTMAFYINASFIVFSGAIGLVFGDGGHSGWESASLEFLTRAWVWPRAADWPLLIAIGVLIAFGAWLVSQAYRSCEAGLIAPFEYVAMPLAVTYGMLFWGDWPDAVTWLGIVLIAASGLFVIFRETRLGRGVRWKRPLPRSR